MDIKASSIICIILIFAIKLTLTGKLSAVLHKVWQTRCGMITAWAFVYLYEISLMLILSFGSHLTRLSLWILFLISGVGLYSVCIYIEKKSNIAIYENAANKTRKMSVRVHKVLDNKSSEIENEKIVISLLILIVGFWMIRSFVYFDTTYDALCYEMPRIFQFSTGKSLFINQNAIASNIFVNEWNGELNAVFYRILTGDNISISFGNIEILFYGMLSCYELGRAWLKKHQYLLALAFISMPVNVFLCFTVKSDLLACICLPIFILMLFLYWKTERDGKSDYVLLIGSITVGALGTGARITLIPAVGLAMLVLLAFLFKRGAGVKKLMCLLGITAAVYLVGWSRYALNFIYYGNPFARVDVPNEKIAFSLARLVTTSKAYILDLISASNIFTEGSGTGWALERDMGIIGPFVVVGAIYLLIYVVIWGVKVIRQKKWKCYWAETAIVVGVIGCFVLLLGAMDYYRWSFRYYMPYLGVVAFAIIVVLDNRSSSDIKCKDMWGIHKNYSIISHGLVLLIALNLISTVALSYKVGEVTGSDWNTMLQKTEIERRFAFHPYFLDEYRDTYEYIKNDSYVLACTGINEISEHVYGDNASNHVVYTDMENLQKELSEKEWDAVLVTSGFEDALNVMDANEDYYKYHEGSVNLGVTYLRADKLGTILTLASGVGTMETNDNMSWTWNDIESVYVLENPGEDTDITFQCSLESSTNNADVDIYMNGELVETKNLNNGIVAYSVVIHLKKGTPMELKFVYRGKTIGPNEADSRVLGLKVMDLQLID